MTDSAQESQDQTPAPEAPTHKRDAKVEPVIDGLIAYLEKNYEPDESRRLTIRYLGQAKASFIE